MAYGATPTSVDYSSNQAQWLNALAQSRAASGNWMTTALNTAQPATANLNLPNPTVSESDVGRLGGQMRATADKSANAQIANISARAGGDTSSPLFQLLASNARGGAAASAGAQLAQMQLQQKNQNIQNAQQNASLQNQAQQTANSWALGLGNMTNQSDANRQNWLQLYMKYAPVSIPGNYSGVA